MDTACENASEWNSLLKWAREERGPFLDPNSLTYQFSPQDPTRSSSARSALKYQPQIPNDFGKFKKEHPESQNTFQTDGNTSLGADFYDTSGTLDTKWAIQPNYTGRFTRSQSQLQANLTQMQAEISQASPQVFSGFSHATAANFISQVSLQPSAAISMAAASPSNSSSGIANNPITRSPIAPPPFSSNPLKGRPKRGRND